MRGAGKGKGKEEEYAHRVRLIAGLLPLLRSSANEVKNAVKVRNVLWRQRKINVFKSPSRERAYSLTALKIRCCFFTLEQGSILSLNAITVLCRVNDIVSRGELMKRVSV